AVSGQVQEARPWGLLPHCRLSCPVLSEDHDVAPRVPLLERVTHGEDLAARRFPSGGRASPASARRRRRSATPPPGRAARGDDPAGPRRRADDAPASSPPCPPVEDGTGYTPRSRSKRRRAAAPPAPGRGSSPPAFAGRGTRRFGRPIPLPTAPCAPSARRSAGARPGVAGDRTWPGRGWRAGGWCPATR